MFEARFLATTMLVGAIGAWLPEAAHAATASAPPASAQAPGAATAEATSAGASAASVAAAAQTVRDIRGASPYEDIKNEPPPRLIVDPPFQAPLKFGVFQAQYRVENLRIVPIFGAAATRVSPRAGHLHVTVDDGPWWWADTSDNNTVDVANLPPGPHKVRIQLVNPNHEVFPGQEVTLHFTIAERDGPGH